MADGLSQQWQPPTLDGLSIVDADQVYINGQIVDLDNLVPYTGATKTLDMGSQNLKTTHYASNDSDVVNNKVLSDAIAFVTGGVSLSYLNKITSDQQTVASTEVDFSGIVTANGLYSNSSINIPKTTGSTHGWTMTRQIGTGSVLKDLRFTDTETSTTALLLSDEGQTIYAGLTCDYGTASKIPIWDANKKLVSSGVDSVKITYLDNVTSDIQAQLNGKLSLSGGTMTGALDMGSNKITSSYTPLNVYDLTNKTYVDTAISGSGSLYVLKAGDTMTGPLDMGAYKITSSYTPLNVYDLTNKTYVDTQLALKATLAGGNTFTGDQTINSGTLSINTRFLGTPDGVGSSGNFWLGLRGTGSEIERLAISIAGNRTTGEVSVVGIPKTLTLSSLSASRVLQLDNASNVTASSVTTTELGYLSGVTSNVQTQINSLVAVQGNYVLKAGDTMSGNLEMGSNRVSSSYTPSNIYDLTNKTYVDTQLSLKANLSGANIFTGTNTFSSATPLILSGLTASKVLQLDGSSNVTTSSVTTTELGYLSGVTSSVQTQLNNIVSSQANYVLKAGDTMTGTLYNNNGEFWAYTAGNINKGCSLFGNNADGATYSVYNGGLKSWYGICLYCDYDNTVRHVFNTRDGSTKQTGEIECGSLTTGGPITTTDTSTTAGVLAKRFYLTARGDNQDFIPADEAYGPWYGLGESGIAGFEGRPCLAGFYGCALRTGSGFLALTEAGNVGIGTTDPQYKLDVDGEAGVRGTVSVGISGASANVTPALNLSSTACHIDNNAGQVYLFPAYQGHLAIGRDTVRDSNTTNLVAGVASTGEAQIISVNSNNTAYKPISFASTGFTFTGGPLTINNLGRGWIHQYGSVRLESFVDAAYGWLGTFSNHPLAFYTNNSNPQMTLNTSGNLGIGVTNADVRLVVNGATRSLGSIQAYGNSTGGPSLIYSENASAGEAYAVFHCRNDSGTGSYWFHNSSTRSGDGGPNTATLRNDIGALRLQSQGGNGLTIDAITGYTRQYGGDTSKILFGPNATWSSYLVVGAGTSEVTSTKAQVISTNGNLHVDAASGRGLYLNYYEKLSSNSGFMVSYSPWNHYDTLSINDALYTSSHIYRALNPATSYAIQDNTENRLMLRDNDGYVRHGQVSSFSYQNNSIAWTGLVTINNLLYKRRNAVVILNFNCSWYATSVSNVYISVRLNSMTSGKIYQTHTYQQFMNTVSNHTSATIPLVFSFDEADDWVQLQAFASGAGVTSDSNDSIWINALVIG